MEERLPLITSILAGLCLVTLAYGCTDPATTGPNTTPVTTPSYTLISTPFQESGIDPPYQINAELPLLLENQQLPVEHFNQLVDALVRGNIASFRNNVLEKSPDPPISVGSSYNLKYDQLSPLGQIISLKFMINTYFDGAAHPGEQNLTFTYDLVAGQKLNLEQLFVLGSDYLDRIASSCKMQLNLRDIAYNEAGADPTVENYHNWNITADGLLITFDMYQVAAAAAGSQTVLVPYGELREIIDSHGPLVGLLK